MTRSFRIGRLFGIELRIDPSWLLVFALVTWSLTSLFGSWHPQWPRPLAFTVAVSAAALFFVSIVLHELAHSGVALAYGIPVRDITLHLFGGASNIEKEPPTPTAELLMAAVGPIASVAIGVVLIVASRAFVDDTGSAEEVLASLDPLETLLVWLGPVNVVLGGFNLIPGFPLDGGRVLRAVLWGATGSLERATRAAGVAGQAIGLGFVALGGAIACGVDVPLLGSGVVSGVWLALIGLFLRSAAVAHVRGGVPDAPLIASPAAVPPAPTGPRG